MAIKGAAHGLRSRGSFNVEIKMEGDWFRFNDLMTRFGPAVMGTATAAQEGFAHAYKKKVKENIANGGKRFGYPGHSSKYSSYKSTRGGPSRILYWGGTMLRSVDVMDLPKGKLGVGIPKDIERERYPRERGELLTVSEYANILEHGTFGGLQIPARPVFSDTFSKTNGGMGGMKGLKTYLTTELLVGLRAQGIKIQKL